MALEDQLLEWFSRPTPERGIQHIGDFDAVVGTDRGLTRPENQDRAAIMRCPVDGNSQNFGLVFAVADGMGGMRDGAKCASLALSSFLTSYAHHRAKPLLARLHIAMSDANRTVFRYAHGHGGSTLSVVALDPSGAASANLGDSRIYAFGSKMERLTVDDSMAELMGSPGQELLQFIGMGEGMRPHIGPVKSQESRFVITSDGIHYVNQVTFEAVLTNTPGLKVLAERLQALARWCGSPDNATVIAADADRLLTNGRSLNSSLVEVWDGFAKLYLPLPSISHQAENTPPLQHEPRPTPKKEGVLKRIPSASSKRKIKTNKRKQPSHGTPARRDGSPQLEIKIGPADEGVADVDRR